MSFIVVGVGHWEDVAAEFAIFNLYVLFHLTLAEVIIIIILTIVNPRITRWSQIITSLLREE